MATTGQIVDNSLCKLDRNATQPQELFSNCCLAKNLRRDFRHTWNLFHFLFFLPPARGC